MSYKSYTIGNSYGNLLSVETGIPEEEDTVYITLHDVPDACAVLTRRQARDLATRILDML